MSYVFVLTYGIKDGKREEYLALMKKYRKMMKTDPKFSEVLISWRLFEQEYGGVAGTYVEMYEFKSMKDLRKSDLLEPKWFKEFMTEWHKIKDQHTPVTKSIWNTVV